MLTISVQLWSNTYSVTTVPNNRLRCAQCYVSNPDGILTGQTEQQLNQALAQLQQQTAVEVAIVVLNSIGRNECTHFAHQLFNYWEIGNGQNNTGLLILFVADQRAVRIETGVGIEGLLPDAVCKRILTNQMFPAFQQGNIDAGFVQGVSEIVHTLTTQAAREELLLEKQSEEASFTDMALNYLAISFCVFILLLWISYHVLLFNPKASNNVRYNHITKYYNTIRYVCCIFPLPSILLIIWINKKRSQVRKQPVICGECHSKMELLSEQDEDAYLTASEQAEETAHSIDYDVWVCRSCLNHIILPYEEQNSKYTPCSHCKAKTYALIADVVRQQATEFSAGSGERTYECKHCHYSNISTYVIPQKETLATAVILGGSMASGRRSGGFGGFGGGGFSGGSWGGGFSGGGGAGGNF